MDIKVNNGIWPRSPSACVSFFFIPNRLLLPGRSRVVAPEALTSTPETKNSCYSAHEHSALQAFRATAALASSASPAPTTALPADISIETIVALLTTCLGLVVGTPALRPIQWRVWAGKIEREGEEGFMNAEGEVDKDYVGNPFRMLQTRPGFVDIRKQRKEFTEWVKNGGGK